MPNLMLTNRCNFNCSYCFGQDQMPPAVSALDMTRETFMQLIDWTLRDGSPGKMVHLMGGEPTLHKDFVWMAKYVLEQKCELKVFSNLASKNAPDYAAELKDAPVRWVVNVNPPESRTREQDASLKKCLQILGPKVTLTFNMVPEPCAQEWLIDLICEYNLARDIKVGFVLPTLSHKNEHLQDKDYPRVARRVVDFARRCESFDIQLSYECGVPWCAFTAEQMGELWHLNSTFFSSCNSVLDITPDGRVIYCLPLATFRSPHFTKFKNYPEAKNWFESVLMPYRPLGSTSQCYKCTFMKITESACRGGCMARVLHGAQNISMGDADEKV
jgi:radical SAM protein with 4Fe4S-binding SPASM domain